MKNIFNLKIYKEFFKQLKVVGMLMTFLTGFIAFIIPTSTYMDITNNFDNNPVSPTVVSLNDIILVFFILFCITVPILTLSAFNFLNKRNTCDFYHSIPHKRGCLFFSIFSAVLSWIFINLATTTIIFSILYTAFKKYIIFDVTSLITASINIFIISLLVCAAIMLACTLTGNMLNNVLVSGIILFMPRLLIAISINLLSIPFMENFDTVFLLKNTTNMLIGSFFALFGYGSSVSDYYSALSFNTIYTLLLAIIYIVLAAFVFKIRKSEAAGNSSINSKLQTVFRICIGIFITLPSIIWIFDKLIGVNDFEHTSTFIFSIAVNFIIAVIFMFIYELISTKSAGKALFSLAFIPVYIISCVILTGALFSIYNISLNYVPSTDEVDYVHLYNSNDIYNTSYDNDYFNSKIADEKITDTAIINTLVNTLKENIQDFKDDRLFDDNFYTIRITFVCGFREYNRLIYFNYTDYNRMQEEISKSINLDKVFLDLPDIKNSQILLSNSEKTNFTNNFAEKLYEAFLTEVNNNPTPYLSYMHEHFSSETMYSDYYDYNSDNEIYSCHYTCYFIISTYADDKPMIAYIPVITDYDNISAMIFQHSRTDDKNRSKVYNTLTDINSVIHKYDDVNIYITPLKEIPSDNNSINLSYSNYTDYYYYIYEDTDATEYEIKKAEASLNIASDAEAYFLSSIADILNSDASDYFGELYSVSVECISNVASYFDDNVENYYYSEIILYLPADIGISY